MSTSTWTTQALTTERLTLRPWLVDDAPAALDRLRVADLDLAAPRALQPVNISGD